jgi:hypothetical protein
MHVWEYEFFKIQFQINFLLIVLFGSNYISFSVPIEEVNFKVEYIFYDFKRIIKPIVKHPYFKRLL